MRDNGPITNKENELPDGTLLVSKTDTKGKITFVNKAVIDISGFTEAELMGAPHNLVRHPHMPKEAFADLWKTIQSGKPWEGFVKNRSKNGDHYWVRANVTPFVENGAIAGYVSIRSKPSRGQVAALEKLYADIREGRAQDIKIEEGKAVYTSFSARAARAASGVVGRLVIIFATMILLMGLVAWSGLSGMKDSNETIRTIYDDRTVPAGQIGEVLDLMRDNVHQLSLIALEAGSAPPAAKTGKIKENIAKISGIWKEYLATYLTPEEKILAEKMLAKRQAFVKDGLEAGIALAEAGKTAELPAHITGKVMPLFMEAHGLSRDLLALQLRVAKAEYEQAKKDYASHLIGTLIALGVAIAIATFAGRLLLRTISQPLGRLEEHFDYIARGDFAHDIDNEPVPEFQRVNALLRAMKAKLGYAAQEKVEMDRRSEENRKASLAKVADSLQQRVQSVVGTIGDSSELLLGSARTLSANAQQTIDQSRSVSSVTETVTGNVQAVSAASHELSSSINEITRQVSHAAGISQDAVKQAGETDRMVRNLAEAATRIGEVVKLINDIASQTNLLALNATIEAARAGDAGKGFAVVANEVKHLANQTAKATDEIGQQISAIQSETQVAVEAISGITQTIQQINELSGAIAAAVEEQSAATSEIARSVEQAAHGTATASENISVVAQAAEETGGMAKEVFSAATGLKDEAAKLNNEVNAFLRDIRAA
jgi:aerotaxis receptor